VFSQRRGFRRWKITSNDDRVIAFFYRHGLVMGNDTRRFAELSYPRMFSSSDGERIS
jgi:hypothetical protein